MAGSGSGRENRDEGPAHGVAFGTQRRAGARGGRKRGARESSVFDEKLQGKMAFEDRPDVDATDADPVSLEKCGLSACWEDV
eukprot:767037-Hanusia_phi.AAC.1